MSQIRGEPSWILGQLVHGCNQCSSPHQKRGLRKKNAQSEDCFHRHPQGCMQCAIFFDRTNCRPTPEQFEVSGTFNSSGLVHKFNQHQELAISLCKIWCDWANQLYLVGGSKYFFIFPIVVLPKNSIPKELVGWLIFCMTGWFNNQPATLQLIKSSSCYTAITSDLAW